MVENCLGILYRLLAVNISCWQYWGKAQEGGIHLLPYHGLDVAAVLSELLLRDRATVQCLRRVVAGEYEGLVPWLLFFASIHDLGKFHPGFQAKAPDAAARLGHPEYQGSSDVAHWEAGWALWGETDKAELFQDVLDSSCDAGAWGLRPLAEAAFGHHGKPIQGAPWKNPRHKMHKQAARELAGEMAALFLQGASMPEGDECTLSALSWPYAGLLVLSDWIGSSEFWFPHVDESMPLGEYWERARGQASTALRESGILLPRSAGRKAFDELFTGYVPTPLQQYAHGQAVRHGEPQLHIFEDLTGSGKTEAALSCVNAIMSKGGAGGLYVGLPTMATANGMYARLSREYRSLFHPDDHPSMMLAHSARSIHDEFLKSIALEEGEGGGPAEDAESRAVCIRWLADNRKKALLAPCGVGTLDQALLSVLPARHQALRMFGLGRLVLVADEVHAYDEYTRKLLCGLLECQAMLGASAVVLTATLPRAQRRELCDAFRKGLGAAPISLASAAFPLATSVDASGLVETPLEAVREIRIPVDRTTDEADMYSALAAAHEAGACACWIRNTVDAAVEARRVLVEEYGVPEASVILFHARFALGDRLCIEEEVLRRFGKQSTNADRRGYILLSTQVCEQSLDFDVDFMLSDLAPMELLIQRAGRCHRHRRDEPRPAGYETPRLLVLGPEPMDDPAADWYGAALGNAQYVYPFQAVLWRTTRMLADKGVIRLPEDARTLVEGAYDQELVAAPDVLLDADVEAQGVAGARRSMAGYNVLELEPGYCDGASSRGWADEERTPTRLGEDRATLRLLRVEDGRVRLWAGEGTDAKTCARSEVSVPAYRAGEEYIPEQWKAAVEDLRERMPDQGRFCTLVVLERGEEWQGEVLVQGQPKQVQYHPTQGLHFL